MTKPKYGKVVKNSPAMLFVPEMNERRIVSAAMKIAWKPEPMSSERSMG